jgi:hypothetical protein
MAGEWLMSLKSFSCITGLVAVALVVVLFFGVPYSADEGVLEVLPSASAAPVEGIQLALSVSEEHVAVREPVMLRSVVTQKAGGSPVGGATVSFVIERPNGTTTITLTADKNGVADWKYKAQHEGTYSITATASSAGSSTSSGPVTFAAAEIDQPAEHVEPRKATGLIAHLMN